MGQVLHGCATTTEAVRRAIQHSQASLRVLASRYGINQKTVAKWKKRSSVSDLPTGPKDAKSTVLSIEDEAVVVAFRRHTLLPLDDCLYALQPALPHLTRSSLHRCLQRHGISRLPDVEGDKPEKRKFKAYPLGYFHVDIAEVRTEQGGAAQGSARAACGMAAEGSSTFSLLSTGHQSLLLPSFTKKPPGESPVTSCAT
jgi:transposase-like protein